MSDLRFLLDTNVVIRLIKAEENAVELKQRLHFGFSDTAVSQISRIELLSFPKLQKNEEEQIRAFLDQCAVLLITDLVETEAIYMRQRTGLKLPDAIIAATALVNNLKLVTFDEKLARFAAT